MRGVIEVLVGRLSKAVFIMLVLAGALQLSGCAAFAPPRPFTTEAEALAAHGEPTRRWHDDDETTTLEFATQPYGYTCLKVQVDAGGIVLRQWDALDDDNLANVRKGMSKDEIERLLCAHRSVQTFALSGEEVWDWNIANYGPGAATLFNVHFIDGKVVRTSRTYVYPRDHGLFGDPCFGYPLAFGYCGPFSGRWPHPGVRPYGSRFYW